MGRKLPLAVGETSRTACARGLLRGGVEERTDELLSAAVPAERVGWAADLVSGMAASLLAARWNTIDVDVWASGEDAGGRKLPSNAWMTLRRLGWTVSPAEGIRVNDRIVRMAREQAGRTLRSAKWGADLTAGVLATWPVDPVNRTSEEWDVVREAVPGGRYVPSSVIKGRTRQIAAFERQYSRLPADVFELEAAPSIARMLLCPPATDSRRIGPPARLGDGHGEQFGECGFVVDDQHTNTVPTHPLTTEAVLVEAVLVDPLAAHAVATDVLATVTLAGDAVVTGALAMDGLAGGACGAETFASGARHMTILSRFAGRTLCSDFAAAVRRASREDPALLNPRDRRGHWHAPATGIP